MNQPIIVNNPGNGEGAGAAVVWGIVIIVIVVIFLVYGLPRIRGGEGTTINVPDKIDIKTNP